MTKTNKISVPFVSRERDEQLLKWMDLNDNGVSFREIARMYEVGPGSVSRAVNNVRRADAMLAHKEGE